MSETQNTTAELPLNSIGNILSEELLRRASEHAMTTIRRSEEIENDVLHLPVRIRNLDWISLCNETPDIKVAGSHFEKPLHGDQLILFETQTDPEHTRVIVSNTTHQIPLLESGHLTVHIKNDKQLNPKGLLVEHRNGEYGLLAFIPFTNGKKIVGLSTITNSIHRFYYVGNIKTETIVPNISINTRLTLRPLTSRLNEDDTVIIANAASRFRTQIDEWNTVKDALEYFYSIMTGTIDPSYINKLMLLNKTLSFVSA